MFGADATNRLDKLVKIFFAVIVIYLFAGGDVFDCRDLDLAFDDVYFGVRHA